jgi:hypothetical protein
MVGRGFSLGGDRFDQIPAAAIEVVKDSNDAVWLLPRRLSKVNTLLREGEVTPGRSRPSLDSLSSDFL